MCIPYDTTYRFDSYLTKSEYRQLFYLFLKTEGFLGGFQLTSSFSFGAVHGAVRGPTGSVSASRIQRIAPAQLSPNSFCWAASSCCSHATTKRSRFSCGQASCGRQHEKSGTHSPFGPCRDTPSSHNWRCSVVVSQTLFGCFVVIFCSPLSRVFANARVTNGGYRAR